MQSGTRLLLILTFLALAGCTASPSTSPTPSALPVTQSATSRAALAATETPPEPGMTERPLLLWMPEALAPVGSSQAAEAFLNQLARFDVTYPGIQVEAQARRITGEGSALAYLRSAPSVAPSILPDLLLLNREAVIAAAREGLVVTADEAIPASLLQGYYPAALALATVEERTICVPYLLEIQHAVYRETVFSQPPARFDQVLDGPVPFDFPASSSEVNQTLLVQYLGAGGRLSDESGKASLDPVVLSTVLSFYEEGLQKGLIDPAAFQFSDPTPGWNRFVERQSALAITSSTIYLGQDDEVQNAGLLPVPSPEGQAYALASGWCWALLTRDPERQEQALILLNHLLSADNLGAYSLAAGWLPAHPAALAVWGESDPYARFAGPLLENAGILPEATLRPALLALQDSLEAVLLNQVPAFEAAARAASSLSTAATTP